MKRRLKPGMKYFKGIMLGIWGLGLTTGVNALNWPDNIEWRILAMGGIKMAVEDETTQLTLFNFGNPAGLAFLPRNNRIDVGFSGHFQERSSDLDQITFGGTGSEYQGIIFCPNEFLTIQFEPRLLEAKTEPTNASDDPMHSLIKAGVAGAFEIAPKLACGFRLRYAQMGGLDYQGYSKYENVLWVLGMGYQLPVSENHLTGFSIGAEVGSDDEPSDFNRERTDVATASSSTPANLYLTPGQILLTTTITRHTQTESLPLHAGLQFVCDFAELLAAGLVFDFKAREQKIRITEMESDHYQYEEPDLVWEYTNTDNIQINQTEYDYIYGVSPTLSFKIPLADKLQLVTGLQYTSWGTGTTNSRKDTTSSLKQVNTYYGWPDNSSTTSNSEVLQESSETIIHHSTTFGMGLDSSDIRGGLQFEDATSGSEELITLAAGMEATILQWMDLRGGAQMQHPIGMGDYGVTINAGIGLDVFPLSETKSFKRSPRKLNLVIQCHPDQGKLKDTTLFLGYHTTWGKI
jgi:hypothetical protein